MAEEDPEIALLHQLQAGQEAVAWGNDGANGTEQLPSNTEDNHQDKKQVADDQFQRAFSPSGSGAVSDGGDYDPSSVTSIPAVAMASEEQSRSSSRASTRKPKVIGGFIADDSDEDDESSTQVQNSTGLQVPTSNTSNRPISPSPLQSSVSQQDLQTPTENQNDSNIGSFPSSALPVNPSLPGVNSSVQAPSTTTPSVQSASIPKARLPHDRMGILEDRIKDDPKGDIEAWLSLITEYRSRHKLDEARAVYERFFKVFPQAVSLSNLMSISPNV